MLRINRPNILPKLINVLGAPEHPFMYVIDSFNREAYYQTEESSWRQKDAQHGIELADLADCLLDSVSDKST